MATTNYNLLSTQGEAQEIKPDFLPLETGGNGQAMAGKASTKLQLRIANIQDIVTARQNGREFANHYGFSETQATLIATIISELSWNEILYAQGGTISIDTIDGNGGMGVLIEAEDTGPGITNIDQVMMEGYSTSGGLGLGLCGVRRIADAFSIDSKQGQGTKISVTKWLLQRAL